MDGPIQNNQKKDVAVTQEPLSVRPYNTLEIRRLKIPCEIAFELKLPNYFPMLANVFDLIPEHHMKFNIIERGSRES